MYVRLCLRVRGFVELKKIQKSEKNSEVGGWLKPQLGFFFWGGEFCVFCVFGLTSPSFSRIFFIFFNLTRPLTGSKEEKVRDLIVTT